MEENAQRQSSREHKGTKTGLSEAGKWDAFYPTQRRLDIIVRSVGSPRRDLSGEVTWSHMCHHTSQKLTKTIPKTVEQRKTKWLEERNQSLTDRLEITYLPSMMI